MTTVIVKSYGGSSAAAIEKALRELRRKMQYGGVFKEMKRRRHYLKRSEKAKLKHQEAVRRARKLRKKDQGGFKPNYF